MVMLQHKLNVKLSQKQILTPGLVQMVSVLALNKIELKDMINAEMMENPVLEELDSTVPLLDEVAGREEERERAAAAVGEEPVAPEAPKSDPFEEIDFGSFFNEYLDPGYRSPEMEFAEKPSFENFLSKPTTLTEHLMWQLGAMNVRPAVRDAAELVIGNLNEDGYLTASDEELMAAAAGLTLAMPPNPPVEEEKKKRSRPATASERDAQRDAADALDAEQYRAEAGDSPALTLDGPEEEFAGDLGVEFGDELQAELGGTDELMRATRAANDIDEGVGEANPELAASSLADSASADEVRAMQASLDEAAAPMPTESAGGSPASTQAEAAAAVEPENAEAGPRRSNVLQMPGRSPFTLDELHEAIALVRQMDPMGVASRDLRECLLAQLQYLQIAHEDGRDIGSTTNGETADVLADAIRIVSEYLKEVVNKQHKEIGRTLGRPIESVMKALDFLKTLDPKPGLRYNKVEARLIEPDVAYVKQGDDYIVVLNDEDVPQLRLNPTYKRLLNRDAADKDVRGYVKERYKSAIQLIKNIEQRKQTILKVCYAILGRQKDFLDKGIDQLKPMMIKEVAEEIGVHPSTVSRAVANKYAHTPQGVFELRYFFSESVNGPEGGNTSLLILKRRVKKLIEDEDPSKPLTDEQITRILQSQGIQVTRRTVAKYREDMRIPSTHQRRVKK